MPVLQCEPFIYPSDLFTRSEDGAEESQWWVIRSRPRAEKAVARQLLARKHPFFLPTYRRCWRNKQRQQEAFIPLFAGYLFVRGGEESRRAALETNQVVTTFTTSDQNGLQRDLERVHRLLESDTPLIPEERLVEGALVEIMEGPLRGLVGKFVRRGGGARIVIEVELLRQGVSVEIDGWMLRALEKSSLPLEP
jgi:transcription antitermination factor NusG